MDLSDATVGQVLIPVDDLDRAIAFYRDVLGLRFCGRERQGAVANIQGAFPLGLL